MAVRLVRGLEGSHSPLMATASGLHAEVGCRNGDLAQPCGSKYQHLRPLAPRTMGMFLEPGSLNVGYLQLLGTFQGMGP